MDIEDLPLLELFTRLQKASLPLGIGEYKLLLQAIRGGFGFPDRPALARLCCTLWVKSPQDKRIFDYHFEQVIGKPDSLPLTSSSHVSIDEDSSESATNLAKRQTNRTLRNLGLGGVLLLSMVIIYSDSLIKENSTQNTEENTNPKTEEEPIQNTEANPTIIAIPNITSTTSQPLFWGGLLTIAFTMVIGVIAVRWASQKIAKRLSGYKRQISIASQNQAHTSFSEQLTQELNKIEIAQLVKSDRFLMNHEYFPLTPRQMKQSWRYLRRLERSGKATELDIKATVNQISRQGFLLKPVLVPPRINRTQLLLLIDYDGSMLPFHRLADRLAETVQQAGKLGKTSIYYFQNCPLEYLYQDPYHQQAELISQILPKLDAQCTLALILSDAGALRGGLNPKRINLTADFLEQLRQQVNYLAWLNPMPHDRWQGTSAGEIARLVPMLEVSSQGFQETINVLRGYLKR